MCCWLRASMYCLPPLVVSLAWEKDNLALDDQRTCSGYIALDGGEGQKRRGWLYTRLYPTCQGGLEHPCTRPRGCASGRQTSTRRANKTFCWQAVSVPVWYQFPVTLGPCNRDLVVWERVILVAVIGSQLKTLKEDNTSEKSTYSPLMAAAANFSSRWWALVTCLTSNRESLVP